MECEWADNELAAYRRTDPEHLWRLTKELVSAVWNDWQLTMIGCGPFEDLVIVGYGERVLHELESSADLSGEMVRMLRSGCMNLRVPL